MQPDSYISFHTNTIAIKKNICGVKTYFICQYNRQNELDVSKATESLWQHRRNVYCFIRVAFYLVRTTVKHVRKI